jgi:hypothetical protein
MPTEDEAASPADPLTRAQAAYASGNFAELRREAATLHGAPDAEVARKARELEARVEIDRWSWAVLAIALALFCGIVVAYAR